MSAQPRHELTESPPFRPLRLIAVVVLIMLTISLAAQWYARNITLPRYCEQPQQTLERVHRLLTERQPAGEGDRKPYIVAARLTFLVPRMPDETVADYLARLQADIDRQCR